MYKCVLLRMFRCEGVWFFAAVAIFVISIGLRTAAQAQSAGITVFKPFTVQGHVVDAQTHQPITQFQVLTGPRWPNGPVVASDDAAEYDMYRPQSFDGGTYRVEIPSLPQGVQDWMIRIVAKGYRPAFSPALKTSCTQDFELTPAKDYMGRVFDPSGAPAGGAKLFVIPHHQVIDLFHTPHVWLPGVEVATDSNGAYSVPPQLGKFELMATDNQGYAYLNQDTLPKNPEIHLSSWGRVEGRMMNGKNPVAGGRVALHADNSYRFDYTDVYIDQTAQTDTDGRFVFERAIPGNMLVGRSIDEHRGSKYNIPIDLAQTSILVTGGKTNSVNLGGQGRAVEGRLILPPELAGRTDWNAECGGPNYTEISPDGKVRVNDVMPGNYVIGVDIYHNGEGSIIAFGSCSVTMPEGGNVNDDPLPAPEIRVQMEPKARAYTDGPHPIIGGMAIDREGNLIDSVGIEISWNSSETGNANGSTTQPIVTKIEVGTASNGQWQTDAVPQSALSTVHIKADRPGCLETLDFSPSVKELLDRKAKLLFTNSAELTGQVVDPSGKPITGAFVKAYGVGGNDSYQVASDISDANGHFDLNYVPRGDVIVSAILQSVAPAEQHLHVPEEPAHKTVTSLAPLRIVLGDSHRVLHGRVTDGKGTSIEGASVSDGGNQLAPDLWFPPTPGSKVVVTDNRGRYEITGAPAGELNANASKAGFFTSNATFLADQDQIDFVLERQAQADVRGTVIDAVTHKPVAEFTVRTGFTGPHAKEPSFPDEGGTVFGDGKYEQVLKAEQPDDDAMYLQIQAKGYMPAVSPPIRESGTVDFQLQPTGEWGGRVLDAKGKPVAGLWFELGNSNTFRQHLVPPLAKTDKDGRFSISPRLGRFILIANNDQGYLILDQQDVYPARDWILTSWGRIEGRVNLPGNYKQGQIDMSFSDPLSRIPGVEFYFGIITYEAKLDDQDRFTLGPIPPGQVHLSLRLIQKGSSGAVISILEDAADIQVEAGKTATVTIDETALGRSVTGHIGTSKQWNNKIDGIILAKALRPPNPPSALTQPSMSHEMEIYRRDFLDTAAGQAFTNQAMDSQPYSGTLDASGNFQIDNVPAGDYELVVPFSTPGNETILRYLEFKMPVIQAGNAVQPLKLGEIDAGRLQSTEPKHASGE